MKSKMQQEKKKAVSQKFEFDIDTISLEDLKILYRHFQIENFRNTESATNRDVFLECFTDDDTDGNKDAYLLIRLASILANDAAGIVEFTYVAENGDHRIHDKFVFNKLISCDFDTCDYDHFNDDGSISIVNTLEEYGVLAVVPLLKKYNFLKLVSQD